MPTRRAALAVSLENLGETLVKYSHAMKTNLVVLLRVIRYIRAGKNVYKYIKYCVYLLNRHAALL